MKRYTDKNVIYILHTTYNILNIFLSKLKVYVQSYKVELLAKESSKLEQHNLHKMQKNIFSPEGWNWNGAIGA